MYVRQPSQPHGRVTSITLHYFPLVPGDGRSTARVDAIAQSMPEFYFGGFDVRFASFASMERLLQGEDLSIIEVNGAGAEAIYMWDPELSLREFFAFTNRQNRLIRRYPPSR
jgi:hypothetical protein